MVNRDEKEELMLDSAETMCMIEKEMPLSFFDIKSLAQSFGGGGFPLWSSPYQMDVSL